MKVLRISKKNKLLKMDFAHACLGGFTVLTSFNKGISKNLSFKSKLRNQGFLN